jgi:5-methylcytosine-specific restriction protein A
MPGRPLRPCKHRGCSALVADGKTYCERHASEEVKWKPDAVRGNRHERGYGNAWTKRRARILLRDCGLCQVCKRDGRVTVATEVDHRVPKSQGGTDEDDNLQSICNPCHKTKTGAEKASR